MSRASLSCGDCLKILACIPSNHIDFILCDPPFGITNAPWDEVIPFKPMWDELNRILKPSGACCIFGVEPFASSLRLSNWRDYRYDWIYEKTEAKGHLNAKKRPLSAHEVICVFYKKQPKYFPQKTQGHPRKTAKNDRSINSSELYGTQKGVTSYNSTERYPRSVITFKTDKQKNNQHSTQKPIALLEYLIKTYTEEGDSVLDFAMGSGSTGVAAINLNRNFYGIEIDPKKCERAVKWISQVEQEKGNL
ncbi:MAG: site-specific DNA-methyltransferase [Candidatus Pacearchaeota archaeon]